MGVSKTQAFLILRCSLSVSVTVQYVFRKVRCGAPTLGLVGFSIFSGEGGGQTFCLVNFHWP